MTFLVGNNILLFLVLLSLLLGAVLSITSEESTCTSGRDGENAETCASVKKSKGYVNSWDSIVSQKITTIGQIWPPNPKLDFKDNCLLLLTHSFLIRYCPGEDDEPKMITFHHQQNARFRGAFTVPSDDPTHKYRLWVLTSPGMKKADLLAEFDLKLGKVVQLLRIPGTRDGHDAVRDGNSIFFAATHNGYVVEMDLPTPATAEEAEAARFYEMDFDEQIAAAVNITPKFIHKGFNSADHINNIGIHPEVILTSLHGSVGLNPEQQKPGPSRTRHSMLPRGNLFEKEYDDLFYDRKSDLVIDNAGGSCHSIAFLEDKENNEIKLLTLDSKNGALVTVVVASVDGSVPVNNRKREVLWTPDLKHPVIVRKERYKEMLVFSKGLAVQGGVAYFCVSGARRPMDRTRNFSVLLVAYDLKKKEELWVRTIDSSGLINQIVTMEYLNTGCGEKNGEISPCFEWPEDLETRSDSHEKFRHNKGETLESARKVMKGGRSRRSG